MVQAMINISKETNQVLNIVKARYDLKDKSQAIERVALEYAQELEPALKPEFVEKMRTRAKEETVRTKGFKEHFGL